MNIIQLIMDYGLDTFFIALCTVVLTGLFKIPIKKLADKAKNSKKITKFITFLPILFGFGLTVLCTYLLTKQVDFNKDFYVQWLSSVSLSLAIYAILEKFIPSKRKILSEAEIAANQALIEELKGKLTEIKKSSGDSQPFENVIQAIEQTECEQADNQRKIILTNNKNK